jgi:drug/metabolite transporter (DMT)-like permease
LARWSGVAGRIAAVGDRHAAGQAQPMLTGALALIAASSLYAVASMLVKREAPRLNILTQNTYRLAVAAVAMSAIFLATRSLTVLTEVPREALLALLAAVLCGLTFGDTLSYRAMLLIGMGRAFPIANTYPIVTVIIAVTWLGETVGPTEIAGCLVTVVGVTLVALPAHGHAEPAIDRRAYLTGLAMAGGAAVLWAGSNSFLRVAMDSIDPITGNTLRLPAATLIAWLIARRAPPAPALWRLPRPTLAAVVATGLASSVVAGMLTLYGVQQVGAARAAILGSVSPIFGAPLAIVFLKERLTRRILIGTALSVIGIMLVVA